MLIHFGYAVFGVSVGIIFGAIPGMTASMAIIVFLPITYAYDMITSLYLLLGLYVGGVSGGLVPAILINIPGTPASITTVFDGHPMALRGEGDRALKIGIISSFFGGIFSLLLLFLFTPQLSIIAIRFSAVEKFLIILFALTIIAALSKGTMLQGIFAGFLGVFTALIGVFNDNFQMRLVPDFLESDLRYGFSLFPVIIGLFAISQLFEEAEKGMKPNTEKEDTNSDLVKFSLKDFKDQAINLIRSSSIGTFFGILPGVGASAASIFSYSQAKSWSKQPKKLGTGAVEGLVASETANNAVTGGALIPLLSIGIPGDANAAILLGAFMLHGLSVGPLFIRQNPVIWNSILLSMLLNNVIMLLLMFYFIKYISKVIFIPKSRLYPFIIIMCIIGSYSINYGVTFDMWTMLTFGFIGYLFNKFGFSLASYLVGFILGGDLEKYFMDALKGSGGRLSVFFVGRPIALVIWALIAISIFYSIYENQRDKKNDQKIKG